jgi:hypothetical protein
MTSFLLVVLFDYPTPPPPLLVTHTTGMTHIKIILIIPYPPFSTMNGRQRNATNAQIWVKSTTRIMVATVRHVTSSSGLRKFQTDWLLSDRVYVPDSSSTLHFKRRFLTNPSLLIAHYNPHTSSDANLPSRLLPKTRILKYTSMYSIIFDFFQRPLRNYNTTFRKQSHLQKHSVRDIQQTMEKVPQNKRNST